MKVTVTQPDRVCTPEEAVQVLELLRASYDGLTPSQKISAKAALIDMAAREEAERAVYQGNC